MICRYSTPTIIGDNLVPILHHLHLILLPLIPINGYTQPKALEPKYAVLVAKHCSGFSLWPTKAHEYSIKNSPYKNGKGDIVAEFVASCRKYGIKPGIYASTTANGFLHVDNPGLVKKGSPVTQEEYNK